MFDNKMYTVLLQHPSRGEIRVDIVKSYDDKRDIVDELDIYNKEYSHFTMRSSYMVRVIELVTSHQNKPYAYGRFEFINEYSKCEKTGVVDWCGIDTEHSEWKKVSDIDDINGDPFPDYHVDDCQLIPFDEFFDDMNVIEIKHLIIMELYKLPEIESLFFN